MIRAPQVRGLVMPSEGRVLAELAGQVAGVTAIVELGAHTGLSTCWLAAGAAAGHGAHVFSIDPWGDPRPGSDDDPFHLGTGEAVLSQYFANLATEGHLGRVTPIRGRSTDVAPLWVQPVGLLFIDAVHEFEAVRADYEAWAPHVVEGGSVAFHDYWADPDCTVRGEVGDFVEAVVRPSGLWTSGYTALGLWTAQRRP